MKNLHIYIFIGFYFSVGGNFIADVLKLKLQKKQRVKLEYNRQQIVDELHRKETRSHEIHEFIFGILQDKFWTESLQETSCKL